MTPIRFFLDEHVDPRVAAGLRNLAIECLTTNEAGRRGLPDEDHLRWCAANRYMVVTEDSDFLALVRTPADHAGVTFVPSGRRSIGEVVRGLHELFNQRTMEDVRNRVHFL